MPRTWPLVGRDEELRAAVRAVGPRGDRAGVVFTGPAGVGKTRLAREAVARVGRGRPVHWALATESAREVPLAAFGTLPGDPASGDVAVSVARIAERLAHGVDGHSAVVAVDDAHLLDDLSALVIQRLVVRRLATVVLTVRAGEIAPDAVASLWKDQALTRLEVSPLTESDTRDLLERVLAGRPDDRTMRRLWALTRGNALFLRHLVDGEVAAGRLRESNGTWSWIDEPEISSELVELVGREMGDLPPPVRDTVDLLALGEPLGVDALRLLTGQEALENAEARGLVNVGEDGEGLRARLAHPMYGEVRRSALGTLRARRLRGLIATTIAATGEADDAPIRRALLVLGSDLPPDPHLFLTGADAAIKVFDLDVAERLGRAAVTAGGGAAAELVRSYALSWSGRGAEAEKILQTLAGRASTPEEVLLIALPRAGNLLWPLNRPDAAEDVLDAARERVTDHRARAPIDAMRVALDSSLGRTEVAFQRGIELFDSGLLAGLPMVVLGGGLTCVAATLGRVELMRRVATVGHAGTGSGINAIPQFGMADSQILGLRLAGEIGEATEVAERLRRVAIDTPGPAQLMGQVLAGHADLATGRVGLVVRVLREALPGLERIDHEFGYRCRTLLTVALALVGDARGARRLLERIETDRHAAYRFLQVDDVLARAWTVAVEGATSEAIALAHEAAAIARETGAAAYQVLALQTATQYGDPSGAARLEELAGLVEGPRAPAALAHARALADRDGDALAEASHRWEEIGDLIAAADAAAQAAVRFRDDDHRGSALAAARRAHELADGPCEGLVTPALRAAARPLPLTDREREIVSLAAGGHSNKEIAERLTVSVRTVEGHLYRAGQKLGVHDRSELAELIGVE